MPLSEDISGDFSDGPCWQKDMKTGRRGILQRSMAFALNKRSLRQASSLMPPGVGGGNGRV